MRFVIVPVFAFFVLILTLPVQAEFRAESLDNDYQSEIKAAADDGKYLVLFFHQAGCPYCDKMRARVLPAPDVMSYFSQHFVLMESNIKGNLDVVMPDGTPATEVEFGQKIRVRATPVFIFYDFDGTPALRTTGYLDEKQFLQAGRFVVDGIYKTDKSFFRYVQEQN